MTSETTDDRDPLLDACPRCGGTDLTLGSEENASFWDHTDTACHDCELVFDARGDLRGGFNSEVAEDLYAAGIAALEDALGVDINEH